MRLLVMLFFSTILCRVNVLFFERFQHPLQLYHLLCTFLKILLPRNQADIGINNKFAFLAFKMNNHFQLKESKHY